MQAPNFPGVDVTTAATLVAGIGDVRRFPVAKHLAGYLGLTPRVLQSRETPARVRPPSRRPLGRVGFSLRVGSSRPRSGALTGSRPGGLVDPGGRGSCSAPADQPCPRRARPAAGVARATPRELTIWNHTAGVSGFPRGPGPVSQGPRSHLFAFFQAQQVEEPADFVARLGGVSEHRCFPVDHVAVAAASPLPVDVAGRDQVSQDALRGSEGDANLVGDVSQAHVGVAGDAEQHLRVVGDELPAPIGAVG
jgi:hypothetical protein